MILKYTKSNIINGAIIYSIGDTIAALVLSEFSFSRMFGIAFIGATFYAFEIPNYFNWIDIKTRQLINLKLTLAKTSLAILYFNPIWIARHLFLINLFSGKLSELGVHLLTISLWSFFVNIPISFIANYIIQNKIHLRKRFLASSIFSAIMAIYYALSETFFS